MRVISRPSSSGIELQGHQPACWREPGSGIRTTSAVTLLSTLPRHTGWHSIDRQLESKRWSYLSATRPRGGRAAVQAHKLRLPPVPPRTKIFPEVLTGKRGDLPGPVGHTKQRGRAIVYDEGCNPRGGGNRGHQLAVSERKAHRAPVGTVIGNPPRRRALSRRRCASSLGLRQNRTMHHAAI